MDGLLTTLLSIVAGAVVLLVMGAVAGSIVTGRQIRDAIAAQPAPVIHNTATANAGGEGGAGVGIGAPQIVGIIGGVALLAWAMTGFRTGAAIDLQAERINALAATAAPMPTIAATAQPMATAAATAQPVVTVAPVVVPQRVVVDSYPQPDTLQNGDGTITLLKVVVGLLVVVIGLWGYAGVMLWRRRSIRRPNVVTPAKAAQARERRMEDILPESVHEVAR